MVMSSFEVQQPRMNEMMYAMEENYYFHYHHHHHWLD
jgi:hypothetical protein